MRHEILTILKGMPNASMHWFDIVLKLREVLPQRRLRESVVVKVCELMVEEGLLVEVEGTDETDTVYQLA